ncbi:MAG: hypothetical protein ACOC9T_00190 [Myxococcota bacterium]
MKRDPEKLRAWLRRSKRLVPKSTRRSAQDEERRALVRRLLRERPYCEVAWAGAEAPCFGPLTVHEVFTRARGGSILDEDNCRVVCAEHNRWLSQTVEGQRWGRAHGFLRARWG